MSFEKSPHLVLAIALVSYRQKVYRTVRELICEFIQMGNGFAARRAPCSPELDDCCFKPRFLNVSLNDGSNHPFRSGLAHRDWLSCGDPAYFKQAQTIFIPMAKT